MGGAKKALGGAAPITSGIGGALVGGKKTATQILDPMGYSPAAAQASKSKQVAQILADTGARPDLASFKSILNQDGSLASQYAVDAPTSINAGQVSANAVNAGSVNAGQLDLAALAADPRALDAMRSRALATGDSPWLQMQLQQQGLDETSARDAAARQALSGAATARNQLAMRGGLGSGASQRLAMGAGRDLNAARQAAGRAGQEDRLGLRIADDQTKTTLLGQTVQADLAGAAQKQDLSKFNVGTALDADKFNVGTALDASKFNSAQSYDASKTNVGNTLDAAKFNSSQAYDATKTNKAAAMAGLGAENNYNMQKYTGDMTGYASGKQAAAIAGGGKK